MSKKALQSPWTFFFIALGFSWLFWIPAAFIKTDIVNSPWVILLYCGGIGPAVGGIALTYLGHTQDYQKEYWQRAFNPKRISPGWYFVALFSYPLLTLLILCPDIARGQIPISETLQDLLSQPTQFIPFLLFIFLFGPFPEELGWRGYALERLEEKLHPVASSLVVGTFWALWHVPLFFMNGTYQNELGFGTAAFWRFCIFAIVASIFFIWIYNNTQKSTLSAALLHFSINLTGNLLITSEAQEIWRIALLIILAIIVARHIRTPLSGQMSQVA